MRLLLIDPNCSLSSPSMKGVVLSLAKLKEVFSEIEVWCWSCDEGLAADRIVKLPRWGLHRIPLLSYEFFSLLVRLKAWWLFKLKGRPRHEVVFTVANYFAPCDVCLVQFSPPDWWRQQGKLGATSLRDAVERVKAALGLVIARNFIRKTTAKMMLCVSESVAEDMRAENASLNIEVLPNAYDANRFHDSVRSEWREDMRKKLGFNENDTVFIFVSAGHYRRKGFYLAVGAVAQLRKLAPEIPCYLLVAGGTESRLRGLKAEMEKRFPSWQEYVRFTGMVPDVEKYFAASDGLLFPSYSEAFALVEVEAAACGLPLFLTRHHGSEMILDEGVNGRYVEFDGNAIAEVLHEYVRGHWKPGKSSKARSLDNEAYAQKLTDLLLSVGSVAKDSHQQKRSTATIAQEREVSLPL